MLAPHRNRYFRRYERLLLASTVFSIFAGAATYAVAGALGVLLAAAIAVYAWIGSITRP